MTHYKYRPWIIIVIIMRSGHQQWHCAAKFYIKTAWSNNILTRVTTKQLSVQFSSTPRCRFPFISSKYCQYVTLKYGPQYVKVTYGSPNLSSGSPERDAGFRLNLTADFKLTATARELITASTYEYVTVLWTLVPFIRNNSSYIPMMVVDSDRSCRRKRWFRSTGITRKRRPTWKKGKPRQWWSLWSRGSAW